jgi:hypothetical protein
VIDTSDPAESRVLGFIPTGWFPSALAVSLDGRRLYVGVGKGVSGAANSPGVWPNREKEPGPSTPYDYVGRTLEGSVFAIDLPDEEQLKAYTRQVRANVPRPVEDFPDQGLAERIQKDAFGRIKHVLYIIRENRTYDQVLGDIGKGNSDSTLTLFGESVTPNAHKVARDGVLLDNLYVSGEVSENGHQWCNAAYATEFTSKAWVQSYSGRPEPKGTEDEPGADERLTASPAGYLWDSCARHHVTYRTYGEFASFRSTPGQAPVFSGAKGLEGHLSAGWTKLTEELQKEYEKKDIKLRDLEKGRDPAFAEVFIAELRAAEKTGDWPQFMVMSLGEDHTAGLTPGYHTPIAAVASNDQALGKIVDAISHSRFWPETAIFVIEDDAQNGPDHVDARRTVGLVISPYVKRGFVDSTLYTTASMVRTMELILGLPPMTQFDGHATPMYNVFTTEPDLAAYDNLRARVDLAATNPDKGPGAEASLQLDFSDYDRANPDELNRILWTALKPGVPLPAPVRSAALAR